MTRKFVQTFSILVCLAVVALAADISGKWEAQVPGRGGEARPATFTFKVDGEKLTGTMSGAREPAALEDGKVSGDTVSFAITTQRGKRTYTGTVSGNEIKFKRDGGQNPQEFTAKRAAS
ncbi:MAG: hypothetical protein JJE04_16390 [Acidobacteriia bacterium]|nr:hypothetical protein [Terriglobia bacterium]